MPRQKTLFTPKDTCGFKTSREEDMLILIITEDKGIICSLCYSICVEKKHELSDLKVEYARYNKCSCDSHLNYITCQKEFEGLFSDIVSCRDLISLNCFLSQSVLLKTILYRLWKSDCDSIMMDLELMESDTFEWDV